MRFLTLSKACALPCLPVLIVAAVLALAAGCGPGRRTFSTLNQTGDTGLHAHDSVRVACPAPDTSSTSDSETSVDTAEADDEDTVYGNPADLIDEAKSDCDAGNFPAADSILKEAVRAIESIDQGAEGGSERIPSSRYFDEIAVIYKEQMPASYAVPEDIAMAVFQRQMMRSIDSMNVLPPDSISLAAIACQKGLDYDVPMVWNRRVQRALSFYIHNRENTVDRWFSRALYYLPLMKKMFADSGLPKDLAYLPLIESGFNPLAYSYANASGIWQFIASTGKIYGLKRSFWVDERRDPIRSTEAAIGYLRKLFGDFGHWHLALAAYNCGENGVSHCIARNKTNDYWNLKRLPKQTKNYVPCYLAALTIAKNPKCFGVTMPPIDPLPLDTVHTADCISLNDIADGLAVDRDTLKKMNPHILRWCTPPDTGALLYLPAGRKRSWNGFLAQLPPEKRVRWYRCEIKRGDDVESLARQYNVPSDALVTINRITAPRLTPGHHLFIPVSAVPLAQGVAYPPPPESEIKALDLPDYEFSGVSIRYRVHSGDFLGRIARHYHVSVTQLCRWNHITGHALLRPGRLLVVSRPQPQVETTPPPVFAQAPATGPQQTLPVVVQTPQGVVQVPVVVQVPMVVQAPQGPTHVVEIGETPFSISRKFNIPLKELATLNGLNLAHPNIKIGQTLQLPPTTVRTVSSDTVKNDTQVAGPQTPLAPARESNEATKRTDSVAASAPAAPLQPPAAAVQKPKGFLYVVATGEDVFRISLRYSVSVDSLMSANHLTDVLLVHAGDTLLIPAAHDTVLNPGVPPSQADVIYYKVKDGDTLTRIAAEFGVPIDNLYKDNKLNPDTVLTPGKVIRVVRAGGL